MPPGDSPFAVKYIIIIINCGAKSRQWAKNKWSYLYGCIYSLDSFNYISFNRKYRGPLYAVDWIKRLFGKVSENLKFQENKSLKEYIKNYATLLNNPGKCYRLVPY